MHPCYKINEETVDDQDWILGRSLIMYGQHEDFGAKILETSTCHVGLKNPNFRISDERFCATSLEPPTSVGVRKYNFQTVVNVFVIGFVCGLMIGMCAYFSTKFNYGNDSYESIGPKTPQRTNEFIELATMSNSARGGEEDTSYRVDHFDDED